MKACACINNRKKLGPGLCLMLSLVLVFGGSPGCGTDVGNSGKPKTSDSSTFASVVGVQFDETIESVLDTFEQQDNALALLALAGESTVVKEQSCLAHPEDGSVTSQRSESRQSETERGRQPVRRIVSDSIERHSEVQLFPRTGGDPLACSDKARTGLRWSQFDGLRLKGTYEKTRERTAVLKADSSLLHQSRLVSKSQREASFDVVSLTTQSITWRRANTFASSLRVESQDKPAFERRVETVDPIVLEKTRVRGTGLTGARIVQGAVQSRADGDKTIILRFDNLTLGLGTECLPSAGQIKGQVYADDKATALESSFTIQFTEEGASLQTQDGAVEELELESCKFPTGLVGSGNP